MGRRFAYASTTLLFKSICLLPYKHPVSVLYQGLTGAYVVPELDVMGYDGVAYAAVLFHVAFVIYVG